MTITKIDNETLKVSYESGFFDLVDRDSAINGEIASIDPKEAINA